MSHGNRLYPAEALSELQETYCAEQTSWYSNQHGDQLQSFYTLSKYRKLFPAGITRSLNHEDVSI